MQSFVFLDVEASGLFPINAMNPLDDPPIPGNRRDLSQTLRNHIRFTSPSQAPHIVEISLMSTTRKAILSGIRKMDVLMSSDEADCRETFRFRSHNFRVPCNIYCAQVKPKMSQREWAEYEKRRLRHDVFVYSREDLEDKNDFATEWKGVRLFLEQTQKPVCIIAHNGLRFDFRILYAEFERNGLQRASPIPDQVYFIDSYLMFLDLEKKFHDELRTSLRTVDLPAQLKSQNQLPSKQHMSCTIDEASQTHIDLISKPYETFESQTVSGSSPKTDSLGIIEESKDVPFVVPVECSRSDPKRSAKRQLFTHTSDDHPLNFMHTAKWSPAKKKRVPPNLFKRSSDGNWMFNNHFSFAYFHEKGVFKLESMHRQLLNSDYDAHYATEDCEALLKICITYGEEFVEYVDTNAVKFPF